MVYLFRLYRLNYMCMDHLNHPHHDPRLLSHTQCRKHPLGDRYRRGWSDTFGYDTPTPHRSHILLPVRRVHTCGGKLELNNIGFCEQLTTRDIPVAKVPGCLTTQSPVLDIHFPFPVRRLSNTQTNKIVTSL